MTDVDAERERRGWQESAAGNGVVLGSVDLNDSDDMKELYGVCNVTGVAAKSRLRAFIREIQQQQDAGHQQTNDTTTVWVEAVSQPPMSHAEYGGNNLLELASFLQEPPPTRAQVLREAFDAWKTKISETELLKYFQPVPGGESCQALSYDIIALLLSPARIIGENEDGYHGRIDECVAKNLSIFAPGFKLRRNSSQDSSSYPLKRPDFSATIPGKGCFFRGEEKKLGSNEDPREELFSKLQDVWPFPGLPFVLGYFSTGAAITFCAVSKNDARPLHGLSFDLDTCQGKFRCWNTMRNVARVIKFWATTANAISPHDLQDIQTIHSAHTDWSRTISFSGGHVLKQISLRDEETQAKLNRLLAVLNILRNGTDGVQPIISFNLSSSVQDRAKRRRTPPCIYLITAFGVPMERVSSSVELKGIVVFLLQTVQRLHGLGITHRDIRLPNIVRNSDGSYALVDWDDSVQGLNNLQNSEVSHLAKETHAPEMFVENGTHDRTVDLWSIGYIIHSNGEFADTMLSTLKDGLMTEASRRMTITEALRRLEV